MADKDDDAPDAGSNARPLDDTVAQTGPGIPDDAAAEGYDPVADIEAEHDAEAHLPTAEELFSKT